jgi:hypothetical protein
MKRNTYKGTILIFGQLFHFMPRQESWFGIVRPSMDCIFKMILHKSVAENDRCMSKEGTDMDMHRVSLALECSDSQD